MMATCGRIPPKTRPSTRRFWMNSPLVSLMLQGLLVQKSFAAGRLHVTTLMGRMGIEAFYRKPNTSKPAPGHKSTPIALSDKYHDRRIATSKNVPE